MKLSLIIPCYNEEESLEKLYKEIVNSFKNIQYELLFVNDGSKDNTSKIIKKLYKEDPDHVLFIDASKDFEKVKNQNMLRDEHIDKIVETYRNRTSIEKYSHLATLKEVSENDYNLNIPRYVDTFEEEEEIDIHAVMQEIKSLEAKRVELDQEIDVYFKELGLVF